MIAVPQAAITIRKLSSEELKKLGVFSWDIWEKGVSKFKYHYDTEERCYFLEGEATIETKEGVSEIQKGDFVIFPKGLSCTWNIKQPVKKYYRFYSSMS